MVRFLNEGELLSHGRVGLRRDALAVAAAALAAVDPASALRRSTRLEGDTLVVCPPAGVDESRRTEQRYPLVGRCVYVVGAGKATVGMASVVDELLGPYIADGAVVVKQGQGTTLRNIELIEAAHPVPDERSLAGGLRLLGIAEQAQPGDLVIALVTGGSSALAVVPAEGLSLADKVAVNRLLLASGADIVSMNAVRKHLSRIKGGQLGAACGCQIVNFTVSDVVGDPLDYFTDLTVADTSTFALAQRTCDAYRLWDRLPRAVADRLRGADPLQETPKHLNGVDSYVLASSSFMCTAALDEARRRGYLAELAGLDLEGESRELGRELAERLVTAPQGTCLIAGGEATVTLGHAAPSSVGGGGPSQEAALAAALALGSPPDQPGVAHPAPAPPPSAGATADEPPSTCALFLDSDGTDGPTDAAGGLIDDLTACAAGERGVNLGAALAAHISHAALARLGDLVMTGPTGTNVNDLKILLKGPGLSMRGGRGGGAGKELLAGRRRAP